MSSLPAFRMLEPGLIIDRLDVGARDEALRIMAEQMVDRGMCRDTFVAAILERERLHPSGLPMAGHKIAIPHTDSRHVLRSGMLFARLPRAVPFHAMGNPTEILQVRLISMFALRDKLEIGPTLQTLITVYQHNDTLEAIIQAPDATEIHRILLDAIERYGR